MIYTDNSEVIRRLEKENEDLRNAVIDLSIEQEYHQADRRFLESILARMTDHLKEAEEENELLREVYEDARYFLRYNGVDKIRADSGYRHLTNSVEAVKLKDSSDDS